MTINFPHFGEIELESGEGFSEAEISLNGRTSSTSVSIDETVSSSPVFLAQATAFMEKLWSLDVQSRKILLDELLQNNPTVVDFIDFHFEEFPDLLQPGTDTANKQHFLERLVLTGVTLSATDEQFSFWIDYKMGDNVSDEILCVKYDGDGFLTEVAHES